MTIVERYHDAMLTKSADALADLYAEDAVHEFPFRIPGLPEAFKGREQIRAGYHAIWDASPIVLTSIDDVRIHPGADPEVVVVEQLAVGTMGGTPFRIPSLIVLRVREDRIVSCRDYMDATALREIRSSA